MIQRTHALAIAAALAAGVALAAVPVVRHLSQPTPATAPAAAENAAAATLPPRIEALEVVPARQLAPGAQLAFKLLGSAGAQAVVHLPDAAATLALKEVSPGNYRGVYLVGTGDNLRANSPVFAELTRGDRKDSATLDAPLLQTAAARSADRPQPAGRHKAAGVAAAAPAARACADCVTVLQVRPLQVKGESTGLGGVTGGVLGAVIGSQVGGGDGRKIAGVAGAVGGALAGTQIEKSMRSHTEYEVLVQRADGSRQGFRYRDMPALRVGDSARIVGSSLVAAGA